MARKLWFSPHVEAQRRRIAEQKAWFGKLHELAEAGDVEGYLETQVEYLKWDDVVSPSRHDMVKMLSMALVKIRGVNSKVG